MEICEANLGSRPKAGIPPAPLARNYWMGFSGDCFVLGIMHIDSYQFGKVVIDGVSYSSDCLIYGGAVEANWWRKQGHLLSAEDLKPIIAAGPSVLVVGCGASGLMEVPSETRQVLKEHNIQLETFDTYKAVQKFNELSQAGINVAAALHLTC